MDSSITTMKTSRAFSRFPLIRAVVAAVMLALLPVMSGCVAVAAASAAGAGVAWIRGALETTLERDLDRSYRAAQNALRQLEFAVVSERKSGVDAALVARTALDKKVEVVLKQVSTNTTHVSIRVGVFGDEELSLAILDRIKVGL
jgi:hypothetical protein